MILSVSELSKTFGDNVLFKNVSFNIEQGDKIGLIGANGVGKTTLFKLLLGKESFDTGGIYKSSALKIGYLEQHVCEAGNKTVLEEVLTVFDDIINMEYELETINKKLLSSTSEDLIERQQFLNEKLLQNGGLTYLSRAKSALLGLGFSEEKQNMPTSSMSGGQRSKIGLCKLLLSNCDLMLLDEPTNHLDVSSIEWLEDYIKASNNAVMVISHDRYFLDKIINRTFEIEHSQLYLFDGNYTRYSEVKKSRELSEQRAYENTMNEVKRIENIIEQQRRWNREKNIKTAESKQKQIDKMVKDLIVPKSELEKVNFKFNSGIQSGNDVLNAENLKVAFSNTVLFENVNLNIKRRDRVFILGDNGVGKTTLIKMLVNNKNNSNIKFGVNVKVGYFDQHEENLNLSNTVFDEIQNAYPKLSNTEVRSALAKFLIKGDSVFKQLNCCSGGERAKVSLCKLMLSESNFLLLDEPTNHLDLYSREALENALEEYNGTLLVVSHDRYFINKLSNKILWLKSNGITNINGNWDNYIEEKLKETVNITAKKQLSEEGKKYYKEKNRLAEIRKMKTKLRQTETEITKIEKEIDEINNLLQQENVATDYQKTIELSEKSEKLNILLEEKIELWETLSENLIN